MDRSLESWRAGAGRALGALPRMAELVARAAFALTPKAFGARLRLDEDADGCVALLFAGAQPGGEVDGASLLCAMIKKGMEPAALAMAALLPESEHVRRAADENGSYAFFLAQEDMPRVAQAILDGGCNPWPASPSNRAGLDSPSFAGRVQASGLLPPDPARLAALRDELDPFKPNPLDDPEHPANHPAFHALAQRMAQARSLASTTAAAASKPPLTRH